MTQTYQERRLAPEHLRHIPLPWQPGRVIPHQHGFAFTIVGSDGNDYYVRTTTHPTADKAKQEMRRLTWSDEQFSKHYGERR